MRRRNLLIALGGTAAAGGATFGTGAFDSVAADRTATVNVVGDASAYLALEPTGEPDNDYENNRYATLTQGGLLALTFDESAGEDGGEGLSKNATYRFDDVFKITNQGTQSITLGYEIDPSTTNGRNNSAHDGVRSFELLDDSGEDLSGTELGVGSSVVVDIRIKTTNDTVTSEDDNELTVRLGTDGIVGGSGPTPEGPVVTTANEQNYDTIRDALNASSAGDKVEIVSPRTFSAPNITTNGITLLDRTGSARIEGTLSIGNSKSKPEGVTVDNCRIGFSKADGNNPGISLQGPQDFTVRRCEITDVEGTASTHGIFIKDGASGTIENNYIHDIRNGNPSDGLVYGIQFNPGGEGTSEVDIRGNTFEAITTKRDVGDVLGLLNNPTDNGVTTGITFDDADVDVTIENNEFLGNEEDDSETRIGVQLRAPDVGGNVTVENNNFENPVGVQNQGDPAPVEAPNNWWDSETGPVPLEDVEELPIGGSGVVGPVQFAPFSQSPIEGAGADRA